MCYDIMNVTKQYVDLVWPWTPTSRVISLISRNMQTRGMCSTTSILPDDGRPFVPGLSK